MVGSEARRELLLGAAAGIGRQLRETACFDEQGLLCNWMGRQDIVDPLLARYSVKAAALGPELYGGSAGVALFLGELYGQTGDRSVLGTAQAALRRSLHYVRRHPTGASPLSFFAGHLGLVYVAWRLADLDACGVPEPGALDPLVAEIVQGPDAPHTMDVISGNAGAIGPLLSLARRPGLAGLAEVAVACGDELCDTAQWHRDRCAWDPRRLSGESVVAPPVTGMSHGVSGVALGLLVLYHVTGERRYLATARGAFAFEDTLYSAEAGNWADTRFGHVEEGGAVGGTFQAAWCHGAPGIALARMHAAHLDPERADVHWRMAEIGVRTTGAAIERDLQRPAHDATLCHGIAGLSEVLLTYGTMFEPGTGTVAEEAALELVRRYGANGQWPSGVNAGGPNPSLMIGVAGVGHHLLRLWDPGTVPPVLAVVP